MENQIKEERNSYVSIYVTPTVKKEFEAAKDNETLKETIIKNFLTSEKNWLEQEIKEIDESTIKYSAKLIGIKEKFAEANESYVNEVQAIYDNAYSTFKKLDSVAKSTSDSLKYTKENLSSVLTSISNIDFYRVEKLLELINKVNAMGNDELTLLKKLLNE